MHLRWILVKYAYRNQFLTYFMHLSLIFLKYASTSRFGAILCIWTEYSWNMLPGIDLELFYAPELNIAEIFFQESILNYFMHLHLGSAGTVYRASNNQGPHRYGITKSHIQSSHQPRSPQICGQKVLQSKYRAANNRGPHSYLGNT